MTWQRRDDGTPYAQQVSVSPTAQNTINQQEGIANMLTGIAGQRAMGIPLSDFNTGNTPYGQNVATGIINEMGVMGDQRNNAPYDPRNYGNLDMYRNDVQDAFMAQQRRNLEPVFKQQYERQQQDLANRGLPVGGEAYEKATSQLNRDQENAWQNASNQAILAAGQEADRKIAAEQGLRGTAMGEGYQDWQQRQADLSNLLQTTQGYRGQAINEDILQRNQNANEAAMLLGASPSMPVPNANPMTNYRLQSPDIIGAHNQAYQNQMSAYNANQAQQGSMWQGAANIAGAAGGLMKCSQAFKTDDGPAERILDRVQQVPIRTWRYRREIDPRQELHIGPYAEDWKRVLGLGNGTEISVIDAFGVLLKCVQELHDDNANMKREIKLLKRKKS